MINSSFYFDRLYPFQDQVLQIINLLDTDFYLSGGTAASRGYLQHRFSDDLDLFVNDDSRFTLWSERVIQAMVRQENWHSQVLLREDRYTRLNLVREQVSLKVEMMNDVPARVGQVVDHPLLGRLDTAQNILANKVTALLDREEPKDLADIWGFCHLMNLSLNEAITQAESKAAGVFPADLARLLLSATEADWQAVRWIQAPPVHDFLAQIHAIGEDLLLI